MNNYGYFEPLHAKMNEPSTPWMPSDFSEVLKLCMGNFFFLKIFHRSIVFGLALLLFSSVFWGKHAAAQTTVDGFNPDANNWVRGVFVLPDSKILLGGRFTTIQSQSITGLAKVDSSGVIDASFNAGLDGSVEKIIRQPDGKFLLGGAFTSVYGQVRNRIARLNSDGSLDATFDPGVGANGTVNGIALQSDGKILIGGNFTSYSGQTRTRIARINSDGSLDTTFNPGSGAGSVVYDFFQQTDGRILVGGAFNTLGGAIRYGLGRLNSDGTLDTTFVNGTSVSALVFVFANQVDGKILVGGSFTKALGQTVASFARLNSDGTFDSSYTVAAQSNTTVTTATLLNDGRILVGGSFETFGGQSTQRIVMLNTDGSIKTTYSPGAALVSGFSPSVYSLAEDAYGRLLVGGSFDLLAGQARNRIGRMFNPGPPSAPTALIGNTAGDGTVQLNWTAPGFDGGSSILSYTVTAAPGGGTCTVSVPATTCNVTGLTVGTSYSFSVIATNANGNSAASSSVAVTPIGVANAPTGLSATTSSGAVQLSWAAPSSDGGSPITSYTVTAAPGGATCTAAAPATTCSVAGLTNGTAYSFSVKATNAAGESAASSSVSATPADVAGAPTGLTATASSGSVLLSWTEPASNGGSPITSYTVTAAPGGATCTATAPSTTCSVAGLTNGTAYSFTVKATNSVGDSAASSSVSATPASVSGAPTGLTVTASNGSAQLSWTAPASNGGSPITSYTVTAAPGGGTCTAAAPATTCRVAGLTNGTTYSFSVKATNGVGDSAASSSVSATPADVAGAPTGLTATASNGSVQLSWTAPASNGGSPITSYTVTAAPGGATCTAVAPATTCSIAGLTNGTAYSFTVKATNSVGDSAASSSVSATPADAPGAPTGLTATANSGAVQLSWTAPASNGGSPITSYTVTAAPGGATCTAVAPATTCSVTGLTNGTAYSFTVKATNAAGDSAASSSVSATPASVAGAPTGLTATVSSGSVQLSWTAPASDGGSPITSYTVTAAPGGATCTVAAPATTCSIAGLTNGTAYSFSVKATNAAGDSASSSSISATPASVAGAPTGLTATVSSGSVQLSWTAPASNGGSPVTSYTVTAAPGGATCTTVAPATTCSIAGLTNGTVYSFTVKATNAAGESAASSSVSATPAGVPDSPSGLTGVTGHGAVQLSWTAPTNNGGSPVSSYTVSAAPGSGTCTVAAPVTTCSVTGLTNGVSYTFTVKATNATGDSAASTGVALIPQMQVQVLSLPSGGVATVKIGLPPGCALNSATINSLLPAGTPGNATAPLGALRFIATGLECANATVPVQIDYPAGSLAGLAPHKYGPANTGGEPKWFVHGVVSGDTVSYSVTDNGVGDNDAVIGNISDPFAPLLTPVQSGTQSVPTLNEWGVILLSMLIGGFACGASRRKIR